MKEIQHFQGSVGVRHTTVGCCRCLRTDRGQTSGCERYNARERERERERESFISSICSGCYFASSFLGSSRRRPTFASHLEPSQSMRRSTPDCAQQSVQPVSLQSLLQTAAARRPTSGPALN